MEFPKKFFHDRVILISVTLIAILLVIGVSLVLLRFDVSKNPTTIVAYRPNISGSSYQSGKPIEDNVVEPTISLEEQAIVFAQDLMEGKKVKLEFDVGFRDEKGYRTAYVYLPDGRMANVELLREGFVRLKVRPPNVKHQDLFKKAYQEARKEQRGFLSY